MAKSTPLPILDFISRLDTRNEQEFLAGVKTLNEFLRKQKSREGRAEVHRIVVHWFAERGTPPELLDTLSLILDVKQKRAHRGHRDPQKFWLAAFCLALNESPNALFFPGDDLSDPKPKKRRKIAAALSLNHKTLEYFEKQVPEFQQAKAAAKFALERHQRTGSDECTVLSLLPMKPMKPKPLKKARAR